MNKKTVQEGHESVQAALLDYTLTCYPSVNVSNIRIYTRYIYIYITIMLLVQDKFKRLLDILPGIHAMAARGEAHLYSMHCDGGAPTQTLLMEMLHAKRKV